MAVTKIYKETDGFCLNLVEGSTFIAELEYPLLYIRGTEVELKDGYTEDRYFIPIADVRDSAGSAIDPQTEAGVRTYIDSEMKK